MLRADHKRLCLGFSESKILPLRTCMQSATHVASSRRPPLTVSLHCLGTGACTLPQLREVINNRQELHLGDLYCGVKSKHRIVMVYISSDGTCQWSPKPHMHILHGVNFHLYACTGNVAPKKTWCRLSIISDAFWGTVDFFYLFASTMCGVSSPESSCRNPRFFTRASVAGSPFRRQCCTP